MTQEKGQGGKKVPSKALMMKLGVGKSEGGAVVNFWRLEGCPVILFFILRAFGNFEECGYLFYKDSSAVSVEGREALQGEWVEDAEEGRSQEATALH